MNERGFTLLEMVVAISIFAVIAAISYSALNNFLDARAHLNQENDKLRGLQTALVLLEQDLRYAVNRAVRDNFGDPEPAFIGTVEEGLAAGERLRLTTLRPTAAGLDTQQATRVAWRLVDGELSRLTWRVLDRAIDSSEQRRRLLANVEEIRLRFFGRQDSDTLTVDDEWSSATTLPVGIEVTLWLDNDAVAYQRILQVSGG